MRLAGEGDAGFVLTLRDITGDMAAETQREAMLAETLDSLRRPTATLATLIEVLPEGALHAPMQGAPKAEVSRLSQAVTRFGAARDEGQGEASSLPQARASDLAEGLVARLAAEGLTVTAKADDLLLRCNGFELIGFLSLMARKVAGTGLADDMRLTMEEEDTDAAIRLSWRGGRVGVGKLEAWLAEPLDGDVPVRFARSVLAAHATEIWPEVPVDGRQALCPSIRQARRAVSRPKPVSRNVVYDFDLLSPARTDRLAEARLDRLTYVVFEPGALAWPQLRHAGAGHRAVVRRCLWPARSPQP